jgi:hypothetical protein
MKKHTSQPLTAARIALRPREHLKLPRMKGNPSDSKAGTGNDIVYQETSCVRGTLCSLDVICTCLADGEVGQQWEKHRNGVKLNGNEVTTCGMGVIIFFVDI